MDISKQIIIILVSISIGLILVIMTGLIFAGYFVGWGPFYKIADIRYRKMIGNSEKYSIKNVKKISNSPLEGMNICYLGSSITYGETSLRETFVEFIAKRNSTKYIKEAVSGTTLVTTNKNDKSYITRMKKINRSAKFDLFVCQLSTNDALQNKSLGSIYDIDIGNICGAINTIIDYVKTTWNCPMVFYTNAYYKNENYYKMVEAMKKISKIKDVGFIDLYTDKSFNDISSKQRSLYLADKIHPTRAGYLEWWTPKIEQYFYDYIGGNEDD